VSAYSPFTKRLAEKLRDSVDFRLNGVDANALRKAFVAALKEEVRARYAEERGEDVIPFGGVPHPLAHVPLVIAGLGSFKMKTRPAKWFANIAPGSHPPCIEKPPARRLAFTSKWEEIK
jgi:hypothetical protein